MPYEKLLVKYESISWRHLSAGTEGYSIANDINFLIWEDDNSPSKKVYYLTIKGHYTDSNKSQ